MAASRPAFSSRTRSAYWMYMKKQRHRYRYYAICCNDSKGPAGSLMNRLSSHSIGRECHEHVENGFRRVLGFNRVV